MKKAILLAALLFALPALLTACTPKPPAPDKQPEPDTPSAQKQREEYAAVTDDAHPDGPYLIQTVFPTEHVIVADIIATEEPYGADPTGQTDSTAAIQAALNACGKNNGGTVFLPAGQYLVTATLEIPHGVILQGDWQDPELAEGTPEYGTVILAKLPPLTEDELNIPSAGTLFHMMSSGAADNGLIGLTVYYPDQDAKDVKPYGYTVYGTLIMSMLRDLTFINSYRGIGCCLAEGGHELLQIQDVRMTALECGYRVKNSSEVGYTTDLRISPSYWIEAGLGFACQDADALRRFCRANTVAMDCIDLDLNQYSTISIESCHTAVLLSGGFWGTFYDLEIKDSRWGVVAKDSLFGTGGVLIANAAIEAEKYAVVNYASDTGMIKLADVKLTGKGDIHAVEGARIMIDNTDDLAQYRPAYKAYRHPAAYLYVADVERSDGRLQDVAPAIQTALEAAAKTGGVVYIPSGVYTLYTPLVVPEGVELRGAAGMAMRDSYGASAKNVPGTVLLTYVNTGDAITLSGNCGIQGIRMLYPSYDMGTALELLNASDAVVNDCVAIRGKGDDVYAVNMVITCAFVGIDFTDCDRHYVKQTFGCCYNNLIRAGGENGYIESVLANQSFTVRQPFYRSGCFDPKKSNAENWAYYGVETADRRFSIIRDSVLRSYCDTVSLIDAKGEEMNNVFMYGCRRILKTDNASALCYNVTSDWQSIESMFLVENQSDVVAINPYRTSGMSHECDETSSLKLYNRLTNGNFYEPTYRSSAGRAESVGGEVIRTVPLLNCDDTDGVQGATVNTDPTYVKEGSGSLKQSDPASGTLFKATLDCDASELGSEDVYLHMWIWAEDTINLDPHGTISLSCSASGVGNSFVWYTESCLAGQSGWTELWLSLDDGWRGLGEYDLSTVKSLEVNVRYNHLKEYAQFYVDDVYLCYVAPYDKVAGPLAPSEVSSYSPTPLTSADPPSRIMIHDCETTEHLTNAAGGNASVNTNASFVQQGDASLRVTPGPYSILEIAFPESDFSAYDKTGYLHLWVYVDDIANLGADGQFELCSGGTCDVGEKTWMINRIRKSGWNELWLPLSEATTDPNSEIAYDPYSINYLRFYVERGENIPVIYVDDIYICNYKGADLYNDDNTGELGQTFELIKLPMLNACEHLISTQNVELNTNPTYVKQGAASFRSTGSLDRLLFTFPNTNVSAYKDGYLHLWLWVDDASLINEGQLELTSSGACDVQENGWSIYGKDLRDGWNELWFSMRSGYTQTGGGLDLTRLNYLRLYLFETGMTRMYIDDIRFVKGDSDELPESLRQGASSSTPATEDGLPVLISGDTLPRGMELGTLNTNRKYVKVGTGSIASAKGIDRIKYIFSPLDISDYMDGALRLWIYIEDAADVTEGHLELSSSGTFDNQEISWSLKPHLTEDGWNELYLPFSAASSTGIFDPTHLNFLRVFIFTESGSQATMYFDDIRFEK